MSVTVSTDNYDIIAVNIRPGIGDSYKGEFVKRGETKSSGGLWTLCFLIIFLYYILN